ncbi:50S ribosomal protein L10 [Candidatus Peregrinibacteria bacterium]|jgi:large subunit ribosomal protein L10|nr:50S ribosomal protein L10 [Candidatus Peregrinibacteria bacterium]MBT4148597.1 50S ribosomal protein L10 [Candidatus Peregrinibacteria bacterium]MBT4366269.1 50S ribosomal protein L10 [Candidatus Peregrinibacteria bacterium]MBT4456135.1 50S ribosomal protein L10 [Candidatus Peregrinibacteria bacterium]
MPVTRQKKEEMLKELIDKFKRAESVVFAQNKGLTVNEVQELRGNLREKNADMKVAKKTLMKIAAKEAGYDQEIPSEFMDGAVGAVFSYDDIVSGAKEVYDYAKKHDALALLGGLLEGRIMSLEEANTLATIPSKEELLTKLVYVLKSPISGFHGALNNTLGGFVRALDAIAKK